MTSENKAEPLFWYRPVCNGEMYEGPVHKASALGKMLLDEKPTEWKPLYEEPPQPQAHEPNIEEAAKVMAEAMDYPWEPMPEQGRQHMRESARKVCAALAKHKEV